MPRYRRQSLFLSFVRGCDDGDNADKTLTQLVTPEDSRHTEILGLGPGTSPDQIQHYTTQKNTTQHTTQHYTTHHTKLHNTMQDYTTLHNTTLHHTTLHNTTLKYTTLYNTTHRIRTQTYMPKAGFKRATPQCQEKWQAVVNEVMNFRFH